jgi:kynurenine formamidase
MRIIDLSVPLTPELRVPAYKDAELFSWKTPYATWENDNYISTKFTAWSHVGTHVDSPHHFVKKAKSIDQLSLETLVGTGILLDLSKKDINGPISSTDLDEALQEVEERGILFQSGWKILLRTDHIKVWPHPDYWIKGPYLSREAADWLVSKKPSLIGYDFFQDIKGPEGKGFPLHTVILGAGVCQLEYINNLDKIQQDNFLLVALPLKVVGAEASLARAIVIEE